jgi:hypothetical protein
MATLVETLIANARVQLKETTPKYWTQAELLNHANSAIKDLWKSIIDLYQDHFVTIDNTNMVLSSTTGEITGIPADAFRVHMIQPRVLGDQSVNQSLVFKPRTLTHPDYVSAQSSRPQQSQYGVVFYAVRNAGAPVGAPAISCRPMLRSDVNLTVWYIPTLASLALGQYNPIPGESDKAIEEYILAFARVKEREDRAPDPEHISIYATEKRNLLVALTPRSDQEPETVVGMWEESDGGVGMN